MKLRIAHFKSRSGRRLFSQELLDTSHTDIFTAAWVTESNVEKSMEFMIYLESSMISIKGGTWLTVLGRVDEDNLRNVRQNLLLSSSGWASLNVIR